MLIGFSVCNIGVSCSPLLGVYSLSNQDTSIWKDCSIRFRSTFVIAGLYSNDYQWCWTMTATGRSGGTEEVSVRDENHRSSNEFWAHKLRRQREKLWWKL